MCSCNAQCNLRKNRCLTKMYDVKRRSEEEDVAVNLLNSLNKFREEETLCDVTLKVGEKPIKVHKNVISASSPYFMAMFSGKFVESDQNEIHMEAIDADCLQLLVDYMYTGDLKIDSGNAKRLLATASFLQISRAEELCCKFMELELDMDNCIEYSLLAGNNATKRLVKSALYIAALNFNHIFSKNDFLDLEFEEMKQLAKGSVEQGQPEDLIYFLVLRWINYSKETRINFIKDFLELLDPSLISPTAVNLPEDEITSNAVFATWRAQIDGESLSNDTWDHILVSRRLGTFRPLRIKMLSQEKHRQIQSLPVNTNDGSFVCSGYYIYHQGGWSCEGLLTDSYVYHPTSCAWAPFVQLQQARAYHRSCVVNGKIYSVGGSDGFKAFPSVEFIDLCTGQRGFIDSLPRPKERPGLGLHENSIYVVGGNDRGTSYNCIHRFDVREGLWEELAPSPHRAGANSCAVVRENIYTTHPDTMQRYDIRTNEWEIVSAQYKRCPPEVFGLGDTLFGLFNDHIAKFIPDGGKWVNQRVLKCNLPYLQVSTKLLFPKINEEEISDPEFEGLDQDYYQLEEGFEMLY